MHCYSHDDETPTVNVATSAHMLATERSARSPRQEIWPTTSLIFVILELQNPVLFSACVLRYFFGAFGSKLTYLSVLVKICAFPNPASMESLQHSNSIDDMIDMMLQVYSSG